MYVLQLGNSALSGGRYSACSAFAMVIDFRWAFLPLLRRTTNAMPATLIGTITATPMPIPILAPVLRPEEAGVGDGLVFVLGVVLVVEAPGVALVADELVALGCCNP